MKKGKSITVTQTKSPIGRQKYQKSCLIGLGLNKINRSKTLQYNESILGIIKKVKHLVKYEIN